MASPEKKTFRREKRKFNIGPRPTNRLLSVNAPVAKSDSQAASIHVDSFGDHDVEEDDYLTMPLKRSKGGKGLSEDEKRLHEALDAAKELTRVKDTKDEETKKITETQSQTADELSHSSPSIPVAPVISRSKEDVIVDGEFEGYPESIDLDGLQDRARLVSREIGILPFEDESVGVFVKKMRIYAESLPPGDVLSASRLVAEGLLPGKGYFGMQGSVRIGAVAENELAAKVMALYKDRNFAWVQAYEFSSLCKAVLTPEVSVRLIMEDMQVDYEDACQVLEDSTAYGVARFDAGDVSDDNSSDDNDDNDNDSNDEAFDPYFGS